jgi:hypothetical protein
MVVTLAISPIPFALSLSKGCPCSFAAKKGQGFDKLSPNGSVHG